MGKWMTKVPPAFLGVLLICLQTGCIGPVKIQPAPSWYEVQSGCYDMQGSQFFHGIGRAADVQNLTLLRATADNRARKELAGVLEQYIQELARTVPGDLDPDWTMLAFDERRQILGNVVRQAMQRAVIFDHWHEPREGALLSLCRLSLSDFKLVLSASRDLNDSMRSAMVTGADGVYGRLARAPSQQP